jgi:aromatic-L-amino-acid/L-tryptophan decarboxylase
VNTGAFDNLDELVSIARSENIWLHVDGAFGSLIILDPQRRHLVSGIDQADSIAFDFHKWLHCPYDAGCVLIRKIGLLEPVFTTHHSYLFVNERSCSAGNLWFNNMGVELSRTFRALKVWFTLKEQGIVKLGEKIGENCEQAQYLVSILEKHADIIRIVRPVTLNIVNFRFEPKELSEADSEIIDAFNNELVSDMQVMGLAVPSTTRIRDKLYIRVAIISHRSTLDDFDIFMDSLLNLYHIRLPASVAKII